MVKGALSGIDGRICRKSLCDTRLFLLLKFLSFLPYTIMGRKAIRVVATPVSGTVDAGYHSVEFNGSLLPSGVYYYRLQAGFQSAIRKFTLLK